MKFYDWQFEKVCQKVLMNKFNYRKFDNGGFKGLVGKRSMIWGEILTWNEKFQLGLQNKGTVCEYSNDLVVLNHQKFNFLNSCDDIYKVQWMNFIFVTSVSTPDILNRSHYKTLAIWGPDTEEFASFVGMLKLCYC